MSLSAKVSLELYGTKVPATVSNLMYAGSNGNKSYFLAVTEKVGCEILTFDRVSGKYESYSPPELKNGNLPTAYVGREVFSIGDRVFIQRILNGSRVLWSFDMAQQGVGFALEMPTRALCHAPKNSNFFALVTDQVVTNYDGDVEKIGQWDPAIPEDRHAQERHCDFHSDRLGVTYHPLFSYINNESQKLGMIAGTPNGVSKRYDLNFECTMLSKLMVERLSGDTLAAYTYYSNERLHNSSSDGAQLYSVFGILFSLLDSKTGKVISSFSQDLNSLFGSPGSALVLSKKGHRVIVPRTLTRLWDGYLLIGETGYWRTAGVLFHQGIIHACFLDRSLKARWSIRVPKRANLPLADIGLIDFTPGYSMILGDQNVSFLYEEVETDREYSDPDQALVLDKIVHRGAGGNSEPSYFRIQKYGILTLATLDRSGGIRYEKVPGSETHDFMIDHTSTQQSGPGEITTMVRFVKSGGYQLARIRVD